MQEVGNHAFGLLPGELHHLHRQRKGPSRSTILLSSQMVIIRVEAWAMIFSHSRQAPRP
jgi:hypothetical protein